MKCVITIDIIENLVVFVFADNIYISLGHLSVALQELK